MEESAEIMAHLDTECEDCQRFFADMSPSMERRMIDLHKELHNPSEYTAVDMPVPVKESDMVGATIAVDRPARGWEWLHSLFQFPSHATGWLGAFAMLVVGIGIQQLYLSEPVIQHEKGIAPVASTIGLDFAVGSRRQDGQLTVRRGTVGGEYPPNTMLFVRYDISSGGYVYLVGYRKGKTELLYPQGKASGEFLPSGEHAVTYDGQVVGFLTLMEAAVRSGVRRVVFASTGGAIYGEQDTFPADEAHPTRPISPYGVAKLSTEHYLYYYSVIYGIRTVVLRYANVYGPRQNPEGEAGVVAIFTSKMLNGDQPVINGDGKQTRDYVYVGDVVRANVLALNSGVAGVYNIGTGLETDVNTLFHRLRSITGAPCDERHAEAKKGEQLRSVLDASRIQRELGWTPAVDLESGLRATVEFFRGSRGQDGTATR